MQWTICIIDYNFCSGREEWNFWYRDISKIHFKINDSTARIIRLLQLETAHVAYKIWHSMPSLFTRSLMIKNKFINTAQRLSFTFEFTDFMLCEMVIQYIMQIVHWNIGERRNPRFMERAVTNLSQRDCSYRSADLHQVDLNCSELGQQDN